MKPIESLPPSVEVLLDGARNALARSEAAESRGDYGLAKNEANFTLALVVEAVKCLAPHAPQEAVALIAAQLGYRGVRKIETTITDVVNHSDKRLFGIKYGGDANGTRTATQRITDTEFYK